MLVEMVAVIGASMAVMAVAVGLIHSAFDLERSVRGQLAGRQAVDRLAEQFRRDVHAAEQAAVEQDPPRCVLSGPGLPDVVYREERGQLVRETLGGDGPDPSQAGTPVAFPLPRGTVVAFELHAEAGRTLAALILGPDLGSLRVDALLDRHSVRPLANKTSVEPPGEVP